MLSEDKHSASHTNVNMHDKKHFIIVYFISIDNNQLKNNLQ